MGLPITERQASEMTGTDLFYTVVRDADGEYGDPYYVRLASLQAYLDAGGGGNVTGPAVSVDNAVARFHGTDGEFIQNSAVIISDAGAVSGVTSLAIGGALTGGTTGAFSGPVTVDDLLLYDTNASHTLTLHWNEDEAGANRTLNVTMGGGDRTFALGANLTIDRLISGIKDEDDMASDSADFLCTQQSIKKYVDDSSSGGDVTAAAVIADHALTRGDGGAKGIQDSGWVLGDDDVLTAAGDLDMDDNDIKNIKDLLAKDGTLNIQLAVSGTVYVKGSADAEEEVDFMEYANDPAAQAAYPSNGHHAITFVADAQLDTGNTKFGPSSLLLDGTGDKLTAPHSADWYFGANPFYIRFWFYPDDTNKVMRFASQGTAAIHQWLFYWHTANGQLHFYQLGPQLGGASNIVSSSVISWSSQWYYIEVSRSGSDWYLFRDGVKIGERNGLSGALTDFNGVLTIGSDYNGPDLQGQLDDFEIGKGVAGHTANYSVPTAPVRTNTNTVMLLHFDGADEATAAVDNSRLEAFSEDTIVSQDTYSLGGFAKQTDSLNDTLTRTLSPAIDLTGIQTLKFDIYSNRTGANIKLGIHDSGGTTTEKTHTQAGAGGWETVTWDISGVADVNKDDIDSIIVTIINADADNEFYIDNFVYLSLVVTEASLDVQDYLYLSNTGLQLADTDDSHNLNIKWNENEASADRTLNFVLGGADRTITLAGDVTLNDWFDQAVKQASNVTFGTIGCEAITSSGASTFNSGSVDADFTVNWNTGVGLFVQGSNGNVGRGTSSPQRDLHIESGVPTIRMSDNNAGTDQAVATLIEFYRGNNANRVGFLGMESSSNNNLRIATDYAAGQIQLGTGNSVTALTIDNSQRVGIGTIPKDWDPITASVLQIFSGENALIGAEGSIQLCQNAYWDNVDNRWEYVTASEASRYNQVGGGHCFEVATAGANPDDPITWISAMTISATGNVGMGAASSASYRLYTENTDKYAFRAKTIRTAGTRWVADFTCAGNSVSARGLVVAVGEDAASGTNYFLDAYEGGGATGYLRSIAGVFQLSNVSDASLKQNIKATVISGRDRIMGLNVRDFEFKKNPGKVIHGFVANEVYGTIPEAAAIDIETGLFSYSRDMMVPTLVKHNQEQEEKIEALEAEVKSLRELVERN